MWTPLPLSPTAGFAFLALSHAAVELDLELATSTPLPVSPLAASPDLDFDLAPPMWIPLPLLPTIEPLWRKIEHLSPMIEHLSPTDLNIGLLAASTLDQAESTPLPVSLSPSVDYIGCAFGHYTNIQEAYNWTHAAFVIYTCSASREGPADFTTIAIINQAMKLKASSSNCSPSAAPRSPV